jgi:hypothetical protein
MPESGVILNYTGKVDNIIIDHLLKKLKQTTEFKSLDKTTGKRLYGIVVECLENIAKHSCKTPAFNSAVLPFLIAKRKHNKIVINTGNCLPESGTEKLAKRLDVVNSMDEKRLTASYEMILNKEVTPDQNGTGLGFILMKMKSGNKIEYNIRKVENSFSYFEMQISINRFIMRKLIIEKTESSPRVILDPDKKIYEISGESRPADVREFYDQIISWLNEFSLHLLSSGNKDETVIFNFSFEYFNSSSGKLILDICKVLACMRQKGITVVVRWHFEKEDADMMEVGTEMSKIVRFPFEFVETGVN